MDHHDAFVRGCDAYETSVGVAPDLDAQQERQLAANLYQTLRDSLGRAPTVAEFEEQGYLALMQIDVTQSGFEVSSVEELKRVGTSRKFDRHKAKALKAAARTLPQRLAELKQWRTEYDNDRREAAEQDELVRKSNIKIAFLEERLRYRRDELPAEIERRRRVGQEMLDAYAAVDAAYRGKEPPVHVLQDLNDGLRPDGTRFEVLPSPLPTEEETVFQAVIRNLYDGNPPADVVEVINTHRLAPGGKPYKPPGSEATAR